MTAYQGWVSGFEVSQSQYQDCQDLVNWYIEQSQNLQQNNLAFYPTPGVQLLSEAPSGGGRAMLSQNGRLFAVIGTVLYQIASDGMLTSLGTVAIDGNPATISGNGDAGTPQLLVTSGGNAYCYDINSGVLTQIAFFDGRAQMGDFIDGYGLIMDTTTATVFISDLFDFSTWDPTQFIQNSATADDWIALKVANRLIYIFGSATTQVWFNQGSFPIPFALHPSGVMQFGCTAPFSPEIVGPLLYWLSGTRNGAGAVLRTGGFSPEVVSTFALHNTFDTYVTLVDAIGDSYEDLGHTFYLLTFPTAKKSWGFDPQLQSWAKRGYWDSSVNDYVATRQFYNAFAFGEHRVLDPLGSGVYRMSSDLGLDVDEAPIRRSRTGPIIQDENKLLTFPQFEADMECGLATASGQGSDPVAFLQWSDDGGKTWSSPLERSAGLRGDYSNRMIWNRCGSGRRRTFRMYVSDPIPWRCMGAFLKIGQPARAA